MKNLAGSWIIIQAYKHNGELHRQWSHSYVLEDTEDFYVLASIRASVIENDGRKWHTKEPAIFILSKKEWFNVIAMMKDEGVAFYVNIASPTIFDKGYLKYIDYDLDVKLFTDGSTKLLDMNEYKKHAKEQNYPEKIKEILSKSVEHTYDLINKKQYPFLPKVINEYYHDFKKTVNQ
ncbi:MAG: DUF402 domain-containing protein [Bacilli bacterium]|nr:DUF402 domain-containing protein [Bacilli bacterium]